MDTRENVTNFWSAHFRREGQQHKALSSDEDSQERAILMVCQTLFLLVRDIKKERDEAIEFASKQKEIKVCQSCKKQVFKDNLDNAIIDEEKTTSSESLDESQVTVMINVKKELGSQGSPRKQESSLSSGETIPSKPVPKAQKKGDPNYRCLSKSSPRRVRKKLKVETDVSDDLVPETLSLDEHELHVNVEARKALATQTVFVPETVMYGNTDFFESQTIFSQDIDYVRSSNESSECRSPEKSLVNASDLKTQLSPVLGKQGNTTPKASRKPLNIRKPTPPIFDSPPKEPLQQVDANIPTEVKTSQMHSTLQINTEDLKSENLVCQAASTPRYSPLKFTHSLSPPLSDVSFTSPSLLPSMKDKGNNVVLTPASPSFKTPNNVKPAVSTRSIKRSLSTVPDSKAKENSNTLRRHQTDSTTNKGRLYEMNVEPPDPNKRKKYKQARIFEMPLVPKTDVVKLSGGVPKMSFDDELKAACEASLKTKEREDLLRRQKREFQSDSSPEKTQSDVKEKKPKLKSPTKLSLKLKESGHSSPAKVLKKSPKKSPLKWQKQSPNKLSPLKKEREAEQDASKDKEMVGLDELLDQVNESPVQGNVNSKVKAPSPKKKLRKACSEHIPSKETAKSDINKNAKRIRAHSIDESPKSAKRKKPPRVFVDSFDAPPDQDIEPGYAYQGPVVRKKIERKQLEGWGCRECKNWYEDEDLDPVKKKMLINKCSRHRSKHNPVTNTPEGFWNPEWVDKTQSQI
ncbi:LOW QUALITY PROTEIN: muscle M-line assembly protein unc-89-like [Macrobrachium nipponense]|uniref:LOW QUALITY PROTEIN: muscle M-line assembly protein unc-89-like n=1 Tax=Macrobrachium nipponense TaxID=159736 RepID=UPI0030C85611